MLLFRITWTWYSICKTFRKFNTHTHRHKHTHTHAHTHTSNLLNIRSYFEIGKSAVNISTNNKLISEENNKTNEPLKK